jgi:hypothetical protein
VISATQGKSRLPGTSRQFYENPYIYVSSTISKGMVCQSDWSEMASLLTDGGILSKSQNSCLFLFHLEADQSFCANHTDQDHLHCNYGHLPAHMCSTTPQEYKRYCVQSSSDFLKTPGHTEILLWTVFDLFLIF